MGQTVKLRRSAVAGKKPNNSQLELGELSVNTTDGKLFFAKSGSQGPSVEEIITTNAQNTGSLEIIGSITGSNFTGSFIGDGRGLYNIPASGVTGLSLDQIASGGSTASIDSSGLHINVDTTVTGSLTATQFTGSGLGLTEVPLALSGSDASNVSINGTFTRIKFDDSTGIKISGTTGGDAVVYLAGVAAEGSNTEGRTAMLEVTGATSTWTFNHSLGEKYPAITVFDSNGNVIIPQNIEVVNDNQLVVSFASPQTGVVTATVGGGLPTIENNYTGRVLSVDSSGIPIWKDTILSGSIDFSTLTDTGSFNSYTSSTNDRLDSLETESGSIRTTLNSHTSSANQRLGALENESGSIRTTFNSYTSSNDTTNTTQNNRISALETESGSIRSDFNIITGSFDGRLDSLEIESGSIRTAFNSHTSSANQKLSSLETESGSIRTAFNAYTSSNNLRNNTQDNRIDDLETESGSIRTTFNSYTSSNDTTNTLQNGRLTSLETASGSMREDFNSYTSSTDQRLGSLETTSGSHDGRLDSIESVTGSFLVSNDLSSLEGRVGSLEVTSGSHDTRIGDLETFETKVDGGLEFTGSNVTIKGDLLVKGTETRVNSTTVEISDNIISLNGSGAANAGIEVRDVTSPGVLSGSLIWDGLTNQWKGGTKGSEERILLNSDLTVLDGRLDSLESTSGSHDGRLDSLETESGSIRTAFNSYTSSNNTTNTTQNSRLDSIEGVTGSFITGYTETQTLDDVTTLGSTTTNSITAAGLNTTTTISVNGTNVVDSNRRIYGSGTSSNTTPAFTFAGDTDTGLTRVGTDQVGLVAAGSRKFYVSNTHAYFQNLPSGVTINGAGIRVEGDATITGSTTVGSIIKSGGTSAQYLMADGSVSTNPGWITGYTETQTLDDVTTLGSTTTNTVTVGSSTHRGGQFQVNDYNSNTDGIRVYGYSNNEMLSLISRYDQADGGLFFKRGNNGSEATIGEINWVSNQFRINAQVGSLAVMTGGFTALSIDSNQVVSLSSGLNVTAGNIDMGTNNITDTKVGQWDTAYSWGDHGSVGYITGYTETQTLDDVTDLGSVTTNDIGIGNLKVTKENTQPVITLLRGGTNPTTNQLIGQMVFQADYDGTPQTWARIDVDTNASSVRTDMDFVVKSTSGNLETGLKLQGGASTPKAFFYNNVDIDGSLIATSIVKDGGTSSQFLMADGSVSTNPGWITGYTDTYLTGATFDTSNGIVTLTKSDGNTVTVDLDGKYAEVGHNHDSVYVNVTGDSMSGNLTFSDDGDGIEFYSTNSLKKIEGTGMVLEVDSSRADDDVLQIKRGTTYHYMWHSGHFTSTDITNWNTAYGWGDHSTVGYLTGYTDTQTTGATFSTSTGVITFTKNDGNQYTVDIDGKYLNLSGGTLAKESQHVAQGSISASNAHLDLYNTWQSDTDQKGSIITFTDNYYDGANYVKTTRAAIKGGTDTTGNTADGYLEFYTDSAGANSPNLVLRLDKSKNAYFSGAISTASHGSSAQWNTAYGWGDHSTAGYLTGYTDTYLTGATLSSNTLTLTKNDGNDVTVDLNSLVDVTVTGGSYNDTTKTLTLTKSDSNDIDITGFTIDTNTVLTGGTFNTSTGNIVLTKNDGNTVSVDMDNVVYGNARGTNDSVTTDNDALDKTGYYTSSAFVTRPIGVANWMYIEHIKLYNSNSNYQKQIGYDTYDDRLWIRTENAGTWSSWKEIWTEGVFANNSSNWDTAYGWGDHSTVGYLTGYTETQTLQNVTDLGANTTNAIGSDLFRGYTYSANSFLDFDDDNGIGKTNTTTLASVGDINFIVDSNGNGTDSFNFLNGSTNPQSGTTFATISAGGLSVNGDIYAHHQVAEDATTKAEMLSYSVASFRPHLTNSGTLAIAQVDSGNSVGMQFTNGAGTANWDIALQPFGGGVGINTVAPGGAFHVYSGTSERFLISGDVHVQGSTDLNINGASRRLSFTSGTGTVRTTTANNLYLQTNSTTAIDIDSNQKVLVGPLLSSNNISTLDVVHLGYVGAQTGAFRIKLPGTHSGNWSMIVLEITVYEYNSNEHCVYHVSGHDWTTGWYNAAVTKIGTGKDIRFGYDANEDVILIGGTTSTWSYPHVTVRVMAHPSFYSGNMDLRGDWAISLITDDSGYTINSHDNRLVWNSSNDGSGSGLDADKVDGLQATSFLRSDADDSFSGNLTSGEGKWIKFYHSNETDSNDGKIGSGVFDSGLNIVGTQTVAGTGRQVRVWGSLITSGDEVYWHSGNDGSGSGLDADTLDGLHASSFQAAGSYLTTTGTAADSDKLDGYQLAGSTSVGSVIFNNKGQDHSTVTDFNTVMTPGTNFIQGGTNGPTGTASHQWYGLMLGLGADYGTSTGSSGHYANQLYWARQSQGGGSYLWARDMEGGSWGSWRKMSAGYADSAGSATNATTASKLTVNGNDTFTGTYNLLWHDSTTVYSSSFMTINGATDTLSVPNVDTNTIDVDGILLENSSDRSGLLEVNSKAGSTSWSGIQIVNGQRWSLMGNNSNWGVYNDSTNEWVILHATNGNVELYHNNAAKLNTRSDGVGITGALVPNSNASYNLGSPTLAWANIYTNDLHLSNMNKEDGNEVDGTKGDWTIQEGQENLYIINNNNGKKYRIKLEEI